MKIGFVGNLYGTPKGHSYVVKDMVDAVMDAGHEVHMYRIGATDLLPDFNKPTTLKSNVELSITKENFEKWLDEIKPDWCVFMEYSQWWDEKHDKVEICKERGIKTAGFLVWERLQWEKLDHYKNYTKLISPTGFQTKLMRSKGLYQTVHIPWGVDIKEIEKIPEPPRDGKVRYYHCAGSGGVGDRKNTKAVIQAYEKIKDENTELMITHLGSKVFGKNEIYSFMKYADVLINTSKWDTIGLNTLEANACGIPAIVCDTDPMNELIKDNMNGLLVKGNTTTNKYVTCPSYEVDVDELSHKMSIIKNKVVLDLLKSNSKKFADINFDWNKNKKPFIEVFN